MLCKNVELLYNTQALTYNTQVLYNTQFPKGLVRKNKLK